jgi:hypothetical protein
LTASQRAVAHYVSSRTIGIGTGRFGICGTHLEPLADLTFPHILQESLPRILMPKNPHRTGATMIVDKHEPVDLFEMVPKLNLHFEPELAHLDEMLDDDELFNLVKADLLKRYPNSGRLGRHSTPVEVILRMLVVKRLYNFSYENTERFVNDSIVLRQFCRLYLD